MVKIVNGIVVSDDAGGSSGSSGSSGTGNGTADAARRFLSQPIPLMGKQVPLYALVGVGGVAALLLVGPRGLLYVLVATAAFFLWTQCNRRGSSGASGSGSSSGGRGRRGPNIKGVKDLPKPPPKS